MDPATLTAIAAVTSAVVGGATATGLIGPKPAKAIAPTPVATPRANSTISDALAKRRGAAANQVTGSGGAESAATAKKTFMGS